MRAIETTPTAIIQQIRTNLRDNYTSGFAILKELVQNADYAGALSLDIGFLAGIAELSAEAHPLLQARSYAS